MTPLSALPIAAAALSLPLAWRTPAHRPLAVALVAAQALEAIRPALPPGAAWGALLALPALSAWAVRRTLLPGSEPARLWPARAVAWAATWCLALWLPWSGWWPLALAGCVAEQAVVWIWWRSEIRVSALWTPVDNSEQTALVLAAGDAGGLLVGLAAGWLLVVQACAIWAGRG